MTAVALVNMPWAMLRAPSIQLSTVKALLAREGIAARVFNFNLDWMQHLAQHGFTVGDYIRVCQASRGLGEWIFAVPPFRETTTKEYESYRALFTEDDARRRAERERLFEKAIAMRSLASAFIGACVDRIVAEEPRVCGFTTTFQQNVPALHLAQLLKAREGKLTTVFGGANCDGVMGATLHRSFPFIDVVVRGEAEAIVGPLFRELVRGEAVSPRSGICHRVGSDRVETPQTAPLPSMGDVPMPDHDDYFGDLPNMSFRAEIAPSWIPFESARGCWWGQKHHCTFCGLNGTSMKFRSKAAARTLEEITTLSKRHKVTHFNATDNIIEMSYFDDFLPAVTQSGWGFHFFYETKANLKKGQVAAMATAGVREIQPGIESLSTPILSLMKKGTTALQNIRTLKWALEHRIEVGWNLIYGFPGEDPADYQKMAALVPSLLHLEPPSCSLLEVHRFSPYHAATDRFPLRLVGPKPFYRHVYPLDEATLADIAYVFDYEYTSPQDPTTYAQPLLEAIEQWERGWRGATLEYRRGPDFLEIVDSRGGQRAHHQLGDIEAKIYLALDASTTASSIVHELQKDAKHGDVVPSLSEVESFLKKLALLRLVYEEDGRYLSLAIPARPPR
jgi:ribosomal peptide maturation radical SAM protein 1